MAAEQCSWCGEAVDRDDGFRALEPEGGRRAVFCRLEHVVPWVIQGAHWSAASDAAVAGAPETCSQCGAKVGDRRIVLVRHRGEHRIADSFCHAEHLLEWAKAGGRYG
jgi:hypothetical protein